MAKNIVSLLIYPIIKRYDYFQWEREEGSLSEWEKRTKTRICQDRGNNKRSIDRQRWWNFSSSERIPSSSMRT